MKKKKKRCGTRFPPSFSAWFLGEMFLLLHSIVSSNFIVWLPLRCEILGNICIVIICKSGCDVINFETSIIFLIKLFILPDQKAKTKVKISWEWKELSRWIKKKIIIFKGLPLKQIKQFFWKVRVRLLKELYFIKVNMIVMGQRRAHETKHTQIFEK